LAGVLYQMPQLGKDEFVAGQFTGLETSWHAKDNGAVNQACGSPGQQGCGIDVFKA
jgi:hypothetical protein